jgi:hypothetical protein
MVLTYKIVIAIQSGYIVWKNGPYPCGTYPDLTIARHKLLHKLLPGEKFIADTLMVGYTWIPLLVSIEMGSGCGFEYMHGTKLLMHRLKSIKYLVYGLETKENTTAWYFTQYVIYNTSRNIRWRNTV